MDPITLVGLVVAIAAILAAMILEGGSPMSIILVPPLILVFFGTFGAALAGLTKQDSAKIGLWFKQALFAPVVPPPTEQITLLVRLAEKARKEGLLALEDEAKKVEDPFLKKALMMTVDGTDGEVLRDVLEAEIDAKKAGDKVGAKFFGAMGGYAPTVGIIGTVLGLIHVLENLSNPEELGHLIAAAFVATLWGVLTANVFWLPMAAKITRTSELQAKSMELLVEGVAEIQAGSNPRVIRQKLSALVGPEAQEAEAA